GPRLARTGPAGRRERTGCQVPGVACRVPRLRGDRRPLTADRSSRLGDMLSYSRNRTRVRVRGGAAPWTAGSPIVSEGERPDLALTKPGTTAPVGAAWIDAAWAVLEAKPEFSMLPHAFEAHEFERLAPGPQPVVYGRATVGVGPRIVFF